MQRKPRLHRRQHRFVRAGKTRIFLRLEAHLSTTELGHRPSFFKDRRGPAAANRAESAFHGRLATPLPVRSLTATGGGEASLRRLRCLAEMADNWRVVAFRFGVFEFYADTEELRRQGRLIPLQRQSSRILAVLLARPGEVVTRRELRRTLWGEDTFVDFEGGLNFAVNRLRAALGDSAFSPRFLETLPRRGYRFLLPVTVVTDAPEAATQALVTAARSGSARHHRALALAAVLLVAVTLAPATKRAVSREGASPEARLAFKRGQAEAAHSAAGRRRSVALFREALRLEPRFAEAAYAMAEVYTDLGAGGDLAPGEAFPAAREAAETALGLEDVPDTRRVLALVHVLFEHDWTAASREYETALRQAPGSNVLWAEYARLLSAAGDHKRALAAIARAEALNPGCDLITHESGSVHLRAGRYADAVRKFRTAAELGTPRGRDATEWRKENLLGVLRAHLLAGWVTQAAADVAEFRRLSGLRAREPIAIGGEAAAIDAFLRRSVEFTEAARQRGPVPGEGLAVLCAMAGDLPDALRWLETAEREHSGRLVYAIQDPEFRALVEDERYVRLLARLGLKTPVSRPLPIAAVF
jgi:DNA-binding winged helix-turn-helix (wHTH) protein